MFTLVNGYACFNCTDIGNAKKGVNPAYPKDDPPHPQTKTQNAGGAADQSQDGPAVILSGALVNSGAADNGADSGADTAGEQRPSSGGYPSATGTYINVFA